MAKATMLKEQRRLSRRELIYYLKITDRKTGRELGRLGDLHLDGMLLLGLEPLTIGAIYEAALELPKGMAREEGFSEMPFKAEAVWVRPAPKGQNYCESGFRFLEYAPKARSVLIRLMETFGMPERA